MPEATPNIDPAVGESYSTHGYLPSGISRPEKRFYAEGKDVLNHLPRLVDLRKCMTPVEQQRKTKACVTNALAGAYEFLIMKNHRILVDVSRLFMYYNARIKGGATPETLTDGGSRITKAIEALKEFGCCKESMFPFRYRNVNKKPPEECFKEAIKYTIEGDTQLRGSLREMKACLAEGYPFIFGMDLFKSFGAAGDNGGHVAMPDFAGEEALQVHDRHAMLAVGYQDRTQCFIVRNSWGKAWGDGGYCYIPYKYMASKEHTREKFCIKFIRKHQVRARTNNASDQASSDYGLGEQSSGQQSFTREDFWQLDESNDSLQPQALTVRVPNHVSRTTSFGVDSSIYIDAQQACIRAIDYLLQNMPRIQALPQSLTFPIIYQCSQPADYGNILNLMLFLDAYQLQKIPIMVITNNYSDSLKFFARQAPLLGVHGWQSRISVQGNPSVLAAKIRGNLINQHDVQRP